MRSQKRVALLSALVLVGAAAFVVLLSIRRTGPRQDRSKQYNVVLILSDALRQDALACYGGPAETPHLDWLVRNGVLFENAHSASPWTSPSAVAMFTGNYATSYEYAREGMLKNPNRAGEEGAVFVPQIFVPRSELLFAECLGQLGYHTGMVNENINASLHENLQGIEFVSQAKPTKITALQLRAITNDELYESWKQSDIYTPSFYFLRYLLLMDPDSKFFAVHWILDPHAPYDPIEKFASSIEVDESKLPVPREFYSKRIYDKTECSALEVKFIKDLYLAEIESVDERVGFVLDVLRHRNLMDNTYIVFTSDHGEQFGERGLFEHGGHGKGCHFYDVLLRVPLIIYGPGLPKGKRIPHNVSLLGLIPTLQEMLGVSYQNDMQGTSFLSSVFGDESENDYLYFDDVQEHDQVDALLKDNHKLIAKKDGTFELYDLASDPGETVDLAGSSPRLAETMFETILEIRRENEQRRKRNLEALGDDLNLMSEEKKRKVVEKLRALGYVD